MFTFFKNSFNIKKCYELARFFSLLSQFEVDELLFVASKKCLSKTGHKNVVLKERGFFLSSLVETQTDLESSKLNFTEKLSS